MNTSNQSLEPDRRDYWIASGLFVVTLSVYIRTLAPDILYGDSAEFQTLVYTLGHTHSTGYPIYLLLARLVGLLPVGNLAWRVNLFSAISAAITVAGVYLIARYFTRNRMGPILGSLLLAGSYTFWLNAIIAEVYTPGTAFIAVIMNFLLRWQEAPEKRSRLLLISAALSVVGVGAHASVGLLAPAAVLLVLWVLVIVRQNHQLVVKSLTRAVLGVIGGGVLLLAAFLFIDWHDPVSSFYHVMLEPSRSIWHLKPEDIDTPAKRIFLTMTGLQWRDAMFPKDLNFDAEVYDYVERASTIEFQWLFLLFALIGLGWAVYKLPRKCLFLVAFLACAIYFTLHYNAPDQYVFYLPSYVVFGSAGGFGIGLMLDWLDRQLRVKPPIQIVLHIGLIGLLTFWMSASFLDSRWEAIKKGVATFVHEDYVFPVERVKEPRVVATQLLRRLPENAVLIMDWRALYTTYYLAHVEMLKPDVRIIEAIPHGSDGNLADSLTAELTQLIQQGYPVFSENLYGDIKDRFHVERSSSVGFYRLSLLDK